MVRVELHGAIETIYKESHLNDLCTQGIAHLDRKSLNKGNIYLRTDSTWDSISYFIFEEIKIFIFKCRWSESEITSFKIEYV